MSGAAQRDAMNEAPVYQVSETENGSGLKQVVAERLAAHRNRRASEQAVAAALAAQVGRRESAARRGASRVRDAVAARYEQSVSYREFLAAEAERALQQAQAEAEVAARTARAVAEAQMQLMEELEDWDRREPLCQPICNPIFEERPTATQQAEARGELAHALADIALGARELIRETSLPAVVASSSLQPGVAAERDAAAMKVFPGGLTVRLFEDAGKARSTPMEWHSGENLAAVDAGEEELYDLDREIEFRRTPEFEPYAVEAQPIPGNLIEFPRQLIAARKARPRLAEGPLREDAPAEPQLRIFEVEAEQISAEPVTVAAAAAPEWQSLLLEASRSAASVAPMEAQHQFTLQPETAPMELRLMAAAVDGFWIGLAFTGFVTVVAKIAGPGLHSLPAALIGASAASVLLMLFVAYQMLFFSLSGATPGMTYARIGLCTFGDRNPSRKAMRRRVLATLLAACPLGLGLAWAWLDEERLGWHDRISRMYQRAY